jgi:hypothetical protein
MPWRAREGTKEGHGGDRGRGKEGQGGVREGSREGQGGSLRPCPPPPLPKWSLLACQGALGRAREGAAREPGRPREAGRPEEAGTPGKQGPPRDAGSPQVPGTMERSGMGQGCRFLASLPGMGQGCREGPCNLVRDPGLSMNASGWDMWTEGITACAHPVAWQ